MCAQRESEREKKTLRWVESPMQGSNPGSQDHDPSQRQTLNWLRHPGAPNMAILNENEQYASGKAVLLHGHK